jgi:hypothetical protein
MNDRQQDADLRARFDAQREVDASETPAFAAMMARARHEAMDAAPARVQPRLNLRRLAYAGGLAAAAAIGGLLMVNPRSNEDAFEQAVQAYQTAGAWQSPTDGLLDVPGSQLISTVPSVGTQ